MGPHEFDIRQQIAAPRAIVYRALLDADAVTCPTA